MELYKGDEGSSPSNSTSISEAIFQTFHPPAPPSSVTHHHNTQDRSVVAAAATTAAESSGGVGLISQLQGFNIFPSQSLPLPIASILANSSNQMYSSTTHDHVPPIYHYQQQQMHQLQQNQQLYSSLLPPPHMPLYGSDHVVLPPIGMPTGFYVGGSGGGGTSLTPFSCLQSEFGKMSAQEMMDAKALAASKSHSEAERRRRERINTHLARLRSLLPSTTKTDKASLLAEVIQHVKELKRQAAEIVEQISVPTECDELTVHSANEEEGGKLVVKASICCDDRSDLLSEVIKALKALKLRTLKAEITTLGGRVKNVLVLTEEDVDCMNLDESKHHYSITSIQDALKAVMERTTSAPDANNNDPSSSSSSANKPTGTGTSTKKQRTTNLSSILEKNL